MAEFNAAKDCVKIQEAAENWEPLRRFLKNGKIDLGDPDALIEYNRGILYTLTGFVLEIPKRNLIPSICLRRTYLRAIEEIGIKARRILDVGTGASAILALLAAYENYEVVATEVDPVSLEFAKRNIQRNGLEITLLRSEGGILEGVLGDEWVGRIDLSMTYPPFYPNDKQGYTSIKKRGFGGTDSELFGGKTGMEFSRQYVEECMRYRVNYCTLMLHKLSYVDDIRQHMQEVGYSSQIIDIVAGNRKRYLVVGNIHNE